MQHRLVIIGSLYENIDLILSAKKRGYYTIVCDGYSFGPGKALADKSYNIDVRNVDEIAKMCIEEKVDGIIGSFSDLIFEKITEIADKAHLKWYVKPNMLKYYRDKNEAKKLLVSLGVKVPKHKLIKLEFSDTEILDMNYPLVIKPVNGWGSKGIYVVNNLKELHKYVIEVCKYTKSDVVQLEEFCNDKEYNVTSFVVDGKVHIVSCGNREKRKLINNTIPILSRIYYSPKKNNELIEAARITLQNFVDYTGQKYGPLSMQCFYSQKNGLRVCEIAGRIFAYEHDIIGQNCGINIPNILLDIVYEKENYKNLILENNYKTNNFYSSLIYFGHDGLIIKNMDNVFSLCKHKNVTNCLIFYNEGEQVNNSSYKSYFSIFSLRTKTKNELDKITKYFNENMKVESNDNQEIIYK